MKETRRVTKAWMDYLQSEEFMQDSQLRWCWFGTITTKEPLNALQADRMMRRYFVHLRTYFRLNDEVGDMFWVGEKFQNRPGYHIHCLIGVNTRHKWHQSKNWLHNARELDTCFQQSMGLTLTIKPPLGEFDSERWCYHTKSGRQVPKHRVQFKHIGSVAKHQAWRENPLEFEHTMEYSIKYVVKYMFKSDGLHDFYRTSAEFHQEEKIIISLDEEREKLTKGERRKRLKSLRRNEAFKRLEAFHRGR